MQLEILICSTAKCPALCNTKIMPTVASKRSSPIQQAGDVGASNAKVCGDVHALARKVICHREAFDAPPHCAGSCYCVAHKVHAPGLVYGQCSHQRHEHANAPGLLAFPDRQTFCCVDAVNALVIDARVLRAQNALDHAIAPTPAGMGGLLDLLAQVPC